jgi:hypothetical protein
MKRISLIAVLVALTSLALVVVAYAQAVPVNAKPFEFVGTADQCAPGPAGTDTVEAAWLTHEGLPDAGNSNHALFLQKLGATSNCAAAGATIQGAAGITLSELGYDVRTDGHCGAGAPRFNVVMSNDPAVVHFIGCAAGPTTGTLTDPQGKTWTRKRWSAADLANGGITFPPITAGSGTVVSINIIFDEGSDTGPDLTGHAFLDNIDINSVLIGKPGLAKP